MKLRLTRFLLVLLASPAVAWSACLHMGNQVVCPINPLTGLPIPDGSQSFVISGGNTCWLFAGGGSGCIPGTSFPLVGAAGPGAPNSALDVLSLGNALQPPGALPLLVDLTTGANVLELIALNRGLPPASIAVASLATTPEAALAQGGPADPSELAAQAARGIARDLRHADPVKQARGKQALELATPEVRALVGDELRRAHLASAQTVDDARAYDGGGALAKGAGHATPQKPPAGDSTPHHRMEAFYDRQVAGYAQDLHAQAAQLEAARQQKRDAQAKLDAHLKGQDWLDYLGGVVAGDPQAEALAKQVADADQRIALAEIRMGATQQALDNTLGQKASLSRGLAVQDVKADPGRLSREESRRYDELMAAHQDFATKRAQFRAGDAQFKALIAALDGLIRTFRGIGQEDSAAAFEVQKEAVQEVHDAWTAGMRTASATRAADISRLHAQNAADGIGPADNAALLDQMGRYAAQGDSRARVNLVDRAAVDRAAGSAGRIAGGASTADPHAYDGWDFAADTARTYVDAYRDPKTFVIRNAYYWKGVGAAVKDGVTEIIVLAGKAGDLAGESIEAALGVDTGLFGREETEALQKLLQGASEMDANTLYRITDSLITQAERRLEQHAGAGETGIRNALADTGYVVGTVAGAEELAFKAVAYAGKLRTLAASLRAAGKADEAAQAAALAKVYDNVADAARRGEASAAPGPAGAELDLPTVGLPPAGTPGAGVATGPSGAPTLVRGVDGKEYPVGKVLGSGLTSKTYEVPGQGLIVKVTDQANPLDDYGYRVLDGIDPSLNAKLVDRQVIDGKVVSVFERADPYSVGRKAQAESAGIPARQVDMTPGQLQAYRDGMEKLNAGGYVWLDAKPNNFAFVPIEGKADAFRLVIIDPGGIVPMKSADAARAAQRHMDAPDATTLQEISRVSPEWQSRMARERMEPFADEVDLEKLNASTGSAYGSIWEIPFNAEMGLHSPSLRDAVRAEAPRDPFRDAPTERDLLTAEDDLPTSSPLSDSEYEDYLRRQGLTEQEIRRAMQAPAVNPFPDDKPFSRLEEAPAFA